MADNVKLECKNAVYVKNDERDGIYASMIKHHPDGRMERFTKIYKAKRKFYVTRPEKRDHKQKRAFEKIENCFEYECDERDFIRTAAKALKQPFFVGSPKKLFRSPYIYNTERSITSLFRAKVFNRYGEIFTPNKVAVLDIETDMLDGSEKPILCSVSCKNRAVVGILKSYLKEIPGGLKEIKDTMKEYLDAYIKDRKIEIEYYVGDTPGDICLRSIEFLHEEKPDVCAAWNINYDLPRIIYWMEKDGHDMAEVFSDPSIPHDLKHFEYKPGKESRHMGKAGEKKLKDEERWAYLDCPCPFIFSDAMQMYYRLRVAGGKELSYSLDYTLQKVLSLTKLKIKGMKNTDGLAWHIEAQKRFKAAYTAYNLFDNVSVETLDEKTKDLSITLPIFKKTSDYKDFSSQTRRTPTDIAYELEKKGIVLCAVSDQMKTKYDEALYSKDQWIVTLPAHGMTRCGLANIAELGGHVTNVYSNNADSDKVSCYPSAQEMANASPNTRVMEMVKMKGLDETTQRSIGIDQLSGKSASAEVVYKANPNMLEFDEVVIAFRKDMGIV